MKKQLRLLTKKDFDNVYKKNYKRITKNFIVYFCKNDLKHARVGVVVSKKVSKLAVDRNLIKRQIRMICQNNPILLKQTDVVIIVRNNYDVNKFELMNDDLSNTLKKILTKGK